jgi:hypothetical protein
MNKLLVGSAALALVAAMAPAAAQVAPPPGVAQGTTVAPAPMARPGAQPRVMIMTNKTMSRAEVADHVGKLFTRLDANRDGSLTREELQARHHNMMAMSGDVGERLAKHGIQLGDRGAAFDRLDSNRDGSISRQEYTAARAQVREQRVIVMRDGAGTRTMDGHAGPGMKMRMHHKGARMGMGFGGKMFDMADANHDGRVTLPEAQAAALAHFDRADANHDGRITPDEHRDMRVMRIERRQS